jgi:hypothetical protein
LSVTLSGKWTDPTGAAVANGTLVLQLSQAAVLISTSQVAPSLVLILLDSTGSISASAPTIFGNDALSPAGTAYFAKVINSNGQTVWQPQQGISIGGSSFNFNTALPTSAGVILANAVLQNPSASQTITGFGLTLAASAPLTVSGTASLNGGGALNGSFSGPTTLTGITTLNSGPVAAGAAATLTGTGACATITTQSGGSWAGSAKCTGTTGASTLTIAPGTTAPNGWVCDVWDETTRANVFQQTSHSPTNCILTVTSVTQNDVFVFKTVAF